MGGDILFCKNCGKSNEEHSLYCSKDGAFLHSTKSNISLRKGNVKFCKSCGQSVQSSHLYCFNCGHSLFNSPKKGSKKTSGKKKNMGLEFHFKDIVKPSLIGFAMLFVISIILMVVVNSSMEEFLIEEFDISMDVKLLKPMDLVLLLNSTDFTLNTLANNSYGIGSVSLSGIPIVFILAPFLIFFIMGVYFAKTNKKLERSIDLKRILFIGLSYGVILSLISIINRGEISLSMPYIRERIAFKRNFSELTSFIDGTLICVLSLLIGYTVYWKFSKKDRIIGSCKFLFDGLFLFFSSILLVSITTAIASKLIPEINLLNENKNLLELGQLGVYTFLMIHLASFKIMGGALGEFDQEKISLLTNTEYIKNEMGNEALIFLYVMELVVFISFFIYGKNAKRRGDKNIVYTTITYSILMGILAHITYIKMFGTGSLELFGELGEVLSGSVSFGFSIMNTIISSFILSTLSSLAGYFLAKKDQGKVMSN